MNFVQLLGIQLFLTGDLCGSLEENLFGVRETGNIRNFQVLDSLTPFSFVSVVVIFFGGGRFGVSRSGRRLLAGHKQETETHHKDEW